MEREKHTKIYKSLLIWILELPTSPPNYQHIDKSSIKFSLDEEEFIVSKELHHFWSNYDRYENIHLEGTTVLFFDTVDKASFSKMNKHEVLVTFLKSENLGEIAQLARD